MTILLKIAWRNVWRQRRRTLLIAAAMGVIMSLLVLFDGVIVGFEQSIYGNAIQLLGGNIQIHAPGYSEKTGQKPLLPLADPAGIIQAAEANPHTVAAAQRIVTGGLVTNREGAFSVSIIGVQPEKESRISPVAGNITIGRYLHPDDGDLIVIGQGLATAMEITVGDRITMAGGSLHDQTRQRTMTVVGVFDVGVPSVEKETIYMSLVEAQGLFGLDGQVTEVVVSLEQIGQEPVVVAQLNKEQPAYEVETWVNSMPELKQTMDMKTSVMNIFGTIMLGIAAIGILNLLMMAVFERTREIGVIGALGLKPREITLLFLLEGILIGLLGALLGVLLGLALTGILGMVGIDYTEFADLTEYTALITGKIYPEFLPIKVLGRAITLAVIAALAALYPAREAARREPAEALHYV
ncbi:MAG: ABC transporter permease [Chloroflexota bacterium]